jgi:hypothetical protein
LPSFGPGCPVDVERAWRIHRKIYKLWCVFLFMLLKIQYAQDCWLIYSCILIILSL